MDRNSKSYQIENFKFLETNEIDHKFSGQESRDLIPAIIGNKEIKLWTKEISITTLEPNK